MNDFDRLYVLIIQYGLAKDCEYEDKIKTLQNLICRQMGCFFLCYFVRGFAVKARACALVGALG